MKRTDLVKALDQLQTSLLRTEEGKKDLDLLVALRIEYMILEYLLKHMEE
jgi:hypothetical protein